METTLENSLSDLETAGIRPPAIVVVGEAVKMRSALDWLGALEGRELEPNPLGREIDSRAG